MYAADGEKEVKVHMGGCFDMVPNASHRSCIGLRGYAVIHTRLPRLIDTITYGEKVLHTQDTEYEDQVKYYEPPTQR